jgi:hypothetical protein
VIPLLGAGVDDEAGPPSFDHVGCKGLCAVNDAPQIDRENALPVLQRAKTGAVGPDAGIVHQDIGAAEPLSHRGFQTGEVVEAADVDGRRHDIGSAAPRDGCQCGGRLGEPVSADIGDADLHADGGEMCGGGKANAGRAAGDHGNVVRRHGGMGHVKFPGRLGGTSARPVIAYFPLVISPRVSSPGRYRNAMPAIPCAPRLWRRARSSGSARPASGRTA